MYDLDLQQLAFHLALLHTMLIPLCIGWVVYKVIKETKGEIK
jgi:hypothetical protein